MEKIRNRYLIVIGALLLLAFTTNYLNYGSLPENNEAVSVIQKIPTSFSGWTGKDLFLSSEVYEILETNSIIHRNYVSDGREVFLSIVYYENSKVDFHAPEACLGGDGQRLTKQPRTLEIEIDGKLSELEVNQLVSKKRDYENLIFYFYKAGPYLGNSYFRLRYSLAINKFIRANKSGVLIRLSTPIKNVEHERESETLKIFISDLMPYLINHL